LSSTEEELSLSLGDTFSSFSAISSDVRHGGSLKSFVHATADESATVSHSTFFAIISSARIVSLSGLATNLKKMITNSSCTCVDANAERSEDVQISGPHHSTSPFVLLGTKTPLVDRGADRRITPETIVVYPATVTEFVRRRKLAPVAAAFANDFREFVRARRMGFAEC
jgi:hypothetical protein